MLMSDDVSPPTSEAEALPSVALTGETADHPGPRPFEIPSLGPMLVQHLEDLLLFWQTAALIVLTSGGR